MDTKTTPDNKSGRPERPKLRAALVALRWSLPALWVAAVIATWPGIPRMFAAFLLAFLLGNALWQHVPLKRACVMAFALTALVALAGELALGTADYAAVPILWLVDALGALIGAIVAFIAMPRIDRAFNPSR